ncbi:Hypp458 [Branchiostoma lanceolatum]|uniref:Hypp458 protein n=1 Tax=Branchiostoma lanceolatum TaxID=7740 RepID=A0A8J9VAF5_BRALA|nr:Hypp458 [Branchiostoma lanceolatum]
MTEVIWLEYQSYFGAVNIQVDAGDGNISADVEASIRDLLEERGLKEDDFDVKRNMDSCFSITLSGARVRVNRSMVLQAIMKKPGFVIQSSAVYYNMDAGYTGYNWTLVRNVARV